MEKFKEAVLKFCTSDPSKPLTQERQAYIVQRLTAVSPFSVPAPSHPTYAAMIYRAIEELKEEGGSSVEEISEFIREEYHGLPWVHRRFLRHHLGKLCESGEIVVSSAGCYSFPSAEPVLKKPQRKRGRGRSRLRKNDVGDEAKGGEQIVLFKESNQRLRPQGRGQKERKKNRGSEGEDEEYFEMAQEEYQKHRRVRGSRCKEKVVGEEIQHVERIETVEGETQSYGRGRWRCCKEDVGEERSMKLKFRCLKERDNVVQKESLGEELRIEVVEGKNQGQMKKRRLCKEYAVQEGDKEKFDITEEGKESCRLERGRQHRENMVEEQTKEEKVQIEVFKGENPWHKTLVANENDEKERELIEMAEEEKRKHRRGRGMQGIGNIVEQNQEEKLEIEGENQEHTQRRRRQRRESVVEEVEREEEEIESFEMVEQESKERRRGRDMGCKEYVTEQGYQVEYELMEDLNQTIQQIVIEEQNCLIGEKNEVIEGKNREEEWKNEVLQDKKIIEEQQQPENPLLLELKTVDEESSQAQNQVQELLQQRQLRHQGWSSSIAEPSMEAMELTSLQQQQKNKQTQPRQLRSRTLRTNQSESVAVLTSAELLPSQCHLELEQRPLRRSTRRRHSEEKLDAEATRGEVVPSGFPFPCEKQLEQTHRGEPQPKSVVDNTLVELPSSDPQLLDDQQQPPRRGRGRPPKPKSVADDTPVKSSSSSDHQFLDEQQQPRRRGRGRPPKPKPET